MKIVSKRGRAIEDQKAFNQEFTITFDVETAPAPKVPAMVYFPEFSSASMDEAMERIVNSAEMKEFSKRLNELLEFDTSAYMAAKKFSNLNFWKPRGDEIIKFTDMEPVDQYFDRAWLEKKCEPDCPFCAMVKGGKA